MMRKLNITLLCGAGLLFAGAAIAAEKYDHVMAVTLPDGSIAQIQYQGKVAPKVVLVQPAPNAAGFDPLADGMTSPFADFDRIAAMMDRQQAEMIQRVAQMRAQADEAVKTQAVAAPQKGAAAPCGVVSYSFVSTSSRDGGCTQTVQWSSDGSQAQPKVYKTSSGDCAKGEAVTPSAPQKVSAPAPKQDQTIPGAAKI